MIIKINILKSKMIVFMLIIQTKNKNSILNNDFAILIAIHYKVYRIILKELQGNILQLNLKRSPEL